MNLSEHFTLEELTFSETAARLGINNIPDTDLIAHAQEFLVPGLEQIRKILGQPIKINSGYRSPALNKAVPGSANTSQHTKFEAADILIPKLGLPSIVCKAIINSGIAFDQMIYEYGSWTHISFSAKPRRSILTKWQGQPYVAGIIDKTGKSLL